jgi:hypothetical protein
LIQAEGKPGAGTVWYWLVKSVFQRQDRTLLPNDEQYWLAALEGVHDYMGWLLGEQKENAKRSTPISRKQASNAEFLRRSRFGVRRSATGRIRRGELDAALTVKPINYVFISLVSWSNLRKPVAARSSRRRDKC